MQDLLRTIIIWAHFDHDFLDHHRKPTVLTFEGKILLQVGVSSEKPFQTSMTIELG